MTFDLTDPRTWSQMIRAPFTPDEIKNLTDAMESAHTAYAKHEERCVRIHRGFARRDCTICGALMEATFALEGVLEGAQVIPAGARVRYHGSLTELHGEYVCGGLCDCWVCEDTTSLRYLLLDDVTREMATCVRPTSVTAA